MISTRFLPKLSATLTVLGSLTLTALPAEAITNFTGSYAPSQWNGTQTTGSANGTANFNSPTNDTLTFTFNSGSATDYIERTINIGPTQAGTLTFSWLFESAGLVGTQSAGYVLNNTYTSLVTASGSPNPIPSGSPVTVIVNNGDTFGFRFTAVDDSSSQGFFDVAAFNAQPVPLESDALPIIVSAAFLGGGLWLKRRFQGRNRGA